VEITSWEEKLYLGKKFFSNGVCVKGGIGVIGVIRVTEEIHFAPIPQLP
jgi:hypothetical protein